jgi:uncharacterized cofD-like protein
MEKNRVKIKNIVAIGGGTGTFTVLSSLKKYDNLNLSAIVSMADSGGSTGRLRDELGVLPPGDVRQCLTALSRSDKLMRDLFCYRYQKGSLSGHSFGNIFLATLEKITGSFKKAVLESSKILNIKGEVIPVVEKKVNFGVKLESGKTVLGEYKISNVKGFDGRQRIKTAFLKPKAKATFEAQKAIEKADVIIICPGALYSSVIPNLLALGICSAIRKSSAKKIYVCNLMTKFGQTNRFAVSDHVKTLEKYLGKNVLDCVIYNTQKPSDKILRYYEKSKEYFVKPDHQNFKPTTCYIGKNLLSRKIVQKVRGDKLKRSLIRHDQARLGVLLYQYFNSSK